MKWTEVKVRTTSESVEAVSNILIEAGASGVAIEDYLDVKNYQEDKLSEWLDLSDFENMEEGASVMAYFPETTFLPEIMPTIKQRINQLPEFGLAIGANEITISEVAESDWATAWKQYYHPVRVTRFLTIVPSWETYKPEFADEKIIELDPGMAFGTGTHPTTRLSLQALETFLRGGETILDVGTGSGVLSIASKHLGAKSVFAYDLDEVAVAAAKENIDLNPVAQDVHVSANDLLQNVNQAADVVVANILADIILRLIEDAWRVLHKGGLFIVSGIIEDKKGEVLEGMFSQGFELLQTFQEKDWVAMVFRKPVEEE